MKRLNLTISFLFCYLLSFAQLDGKMRPGDRLDYNPGPQPEWEPILIAMAAGIGCLMIAGIGFWISWKEDCSKFRKIIGTILMFAGLGGFAFFILPCLMTWRFWVLLVAIGGPILTIACLIYKKREEKEYQNGKENENKEVNWLDYKYIDNVPYADTFSDPPRSGETVSYMKFCSLYKKEEKYFAKSPFDGSCIELERNPYYRENDFGLNSCLYRGKTIIENNKRVFVYLTLPKPKLPGYLPPELKPFFETYNPHVENELLASVWNLENK